MRSIGLKALLLIFTVIIITSNLNCKKREKEDISKKYESLHIKPKNVEPIKRIPFMESLSNIQIVELGSDNIAVWAKNGIRNKTLILFDSVFNIQYKISDELLTEVKHLIDNDNYKKLSEHTGMTSKIKRFYNSFNYIYAAHRLGIIKDVIWVIPLSKSITFDYRDFFKEKIRSDPNFYFSSEDIDSFTFADNRLLGTLFDIPITITALDDLEPPKDPVVVCINLSYLKSFVVNNVTTPIEDITVSFLKAFERKPLFSNYMTIVNSNKNFDVLMQFRFISNILLEIFKNPAYMTAPKAEWVAKQSADNNLAFVNYDGAERIYNEILMTTPDDPAIYFQLALLYLKKRELSKTSDYIEEAVKRDASYILSYIALTDQLQSDEHKLELLQLGYSKHPEDISILSSLANQYYNKGKFRKSLDIYLKLINLGVESFDLNFYIADCYTKLKNYDKALDIYNNTFPLLTEEFKQVYYFYYISLAELYETLNDTENAIKNYEMFLKYSKATIENENIKLKLKRLKRKK